jgi:hypothetical protein
MEQTNGFLKSHFSSGYRNAAIQPPEAPSTCTFKSQPCFAFSAASCSQMPATSSKAPL